MNEFRKGFADVRTRFAPSPTGSLHLGNVRVAVFNWLLARHHGGRFILRIEDTDVERNRTEAEESIFRDLRWLGLEWDEGPDRGGPGAPYRQSEAAPIHGEAAERLVASGHAFRCYCTDEELGAERREESSGVEVLRYSGRCRELDETERQAFEREGRRPALRFRVPEGEIRVEDVVRGPVAFRGEELGDFVIVRRDGRPTYNFAVVVDDVRMEISHVVRGVGHLSNTPKQGLLFDALGAARPTFAHLPTVLGPDGRRLSKREGARAIAELRKEGVHPDAVVNYVSLLGWSSPSGEEILSVEQLVEEMDLVRVGASDTILDPAKLRWLSQQHIARMGLDELARVLEDHVDRTRFPLRDAQVEAAVEAIRTRLTTFGEVNEHLELLFPREGPELAQARRAVREDASARRVLDAAHDAFTAVERWEADALAAEVRSLGKTLGVRGPALFHPIRLALSGERSGPDLGLALAAVGREEALRRIRTTLEGDGGV